MADFVATPSENAVVCNTCRARFQTTEAVREHYRGDWHVMNAKRRSSGMPPISRDEFRRHAPRPKGKPAPGAAIGTAGKGNNSGKSSSPSRGAPETMPSSSNRSRSGGSVPNRPSKSDKVANIPPPALRAAATAPTPHPAPRLSMHKDEEEIVHMALKMGISKERSDLIARIALEEEAADPLALAEKSYLASTDTAKTAKAVQAEGMVGASAQEEGLKTDAGDEGHEEGTEEQGEGEDEDSVEDETVYLPVAPTISLFDEKEFSTSDDCVRYMQETYGFFLPDQQYLTDVDGLLTYLGEKVKIGGICLYCQKRLKPGWPCQAHMRDKSHCKIRYEEGVDADEFEDFYDFTSSYAEGELDSDGELVDEEDEDGPQLKATGELQLADGRIIGHRKFRRIYNQYFAPEDTRPAVLMEKREALIRTEQRVGGLGMDSYEIDRLSDAQVAALFVKERKLERKMLVLAERDQRRYTFREQRREYKSVKDKIRSSENTTAKIRDYHSMLM